MTQRKYAISIPPEVLARIGIGGGFGAIVSDPSPFHDPIVKDVKSLVWVDRNDRAIDHSVFLHLVSWSLATPEDEAASIRHLVGNRLFVEYGIDLTNNPVIVNRVY